MQSSTLLKASTIYKWWIWLTEGIWWLNEFLLLQHNLCMFPRQLKYLRWWQFKKKSALQLQEKKILIFKWWYVARQYYDKKKITEWVIVHDVQLRALAQNRAHFIPFSCFVSTRILFYKKLGHCLSHTKWSSTDYLALFDFYISV